MNRDFFFCYEGDDCAGALRNMQEHNLSHLPVVDHDMRMVALVAREDLSARIGEAITAHREAGTVGE